MGSTEDEKREGKKAVQDEQTQPPLSSDEEFAKGLQEAGEAEQEWAWVQPLSTCPHLNSVPPFKGELPRFDTPCASCGDGKENWVCLACNTVQCGRYRGGHMMAHNKAEGHPLAMGFRDLSVWCFPCSAYLDAEIIAELNPYHEALHVMKFGQAPPRSLQHKLGD